MKLSDYVAQFIADQGIKHVFLISGGAIVHCADSVASHPQLQYICTQHEQGAGAAADAYARVSQNLGVAMVTSGPGATNLLTSVCNAYFDSIPVLYISGQVATFRLRPNEELRQKGFQETDVISIFKSVTKYAKQVLKADDIRYELEQAVYLAKSGRPGPVLLDIPDDLQRVDIDPAKLRSFIPPQERIEIRPDQIKELERLLLQAQRPVLILGAGVRQTQTAQEALRFAEHFHLPVLLTWGGADLLHASHPLHMGCVGVCGPRAGNFAVQNADLVIALGTRLSQMITGGKQNLFAPHARKVMVDIDAQELAKFTPETFVLDLAVRTDLKTFFTQCEGMYASLRSDELMQWRRQIKDWDKRYPICLPEYAKRSDQVDAYVFIKALSNACRAGDIILTDAGGNLSWTMQAFETKENQRLFSAWNHSPMGYSVPASIGAALASGKEIVCITGDGGLMMCLEELGTIRRYDLPVKIFIFNNKGHGIQKQTMDTWLNSRYVAVDHKTGLYFPDFAKVAAAFEMPSFSIANHTEIKSVLAEVMSTPGPVICDVAIAQDQKIVPMLKFGAGLEDLSPPLPAAEVAAIMQLSRNTAEKSNDQTICSR